MPVMPTRPELGRLPTDKNIKDYLDGWNEGFITCKRDSRDYSDGYEACLRDYRRDMANLFEAESALNRREEVLERKNIKREKVLMATDVVNPLCSHELSADVLLMSIYEGDSSAAVRDEVTALKEQVEHLNRALQLCTEARDARATEEETKELSEKLEKAQEQLAQDTEEFATCKAKAEAAVVQARAEFEKEAQVKELAKMKTLKTESNAAAEEKSWAKKLFPFMSKAEDPVAKAVDEARNALLSEKEFEITSLKNKLDAELIRCKNNAETRVAEAKKEQVQYRASVMDQMTELGCRFETEKRRYIAAAASAAELAAEKHAAVAAAAAKLSAENTALEQKTLASQAAGQYEQLSTTFPRTDQIAEYVSQLHGDFGGLLLECVASWYSKTMGPSNAAKGASQEAHRVIEYAQMICASKLETITAASTRHFRTRCMCQDLWALLFPASAMARAGAQDFIQLQKHPSVFHEISNSKEFASLLESCLEQMICIIASSSMSTQNVQIEAFPPQTVMFDASKHKSASAGIKEGSECYVLFPALNCNGGFISGYISKALVLSTEENL